MTDDRRQLRVVVRGAYAVQKLRIEMGNRMVGNFKVKIGQEPCTSERELSTEAKRILADLREVYKKITDAMPARSSVQHFKGEGLISTYTEWVLVDQYKRLEEAETKHFAQLAKVLEEFDIYTQWLRDVRAVGPAMAAVIISEIDIEKAKYVSSLWRYAGLDVGSDGRGRTRRKEHLVDRTYTAKDGSEKTRVGITFNPFLKTKLIGVLGSGFLRASRWEDCTEAGTQGVEPGAFRAVEDTPLNPPLARGEAIAKPGSARYQRLTEECRYAQFYYAHRHRLENHAVFGAANDGAKLEHGIVRPRWRHDKAVRVMVKEFLRDLYNAWRPMVGLPVLPCFSEAKLGMVHGEVESSSGELDRKMRHQAAERKNQENLSKPPHHKRRHPAKMSGK